MENWAPSKLEACGNFRGAAEDKKGDELEAAAWTLTIIYNRFAAMVF